MEIALLSSPDSWYFRDLARAAGSTHRVTQLSFDQITSAIIPGLLASKTSTRVTAGQRDLSKFDAVIIRTMPPGSLEQVVYRMDALAAVELCGTLVLNPPKAIEAAVDKFLTTSRLAAAGLPTPRTIVCQTLEAAMDAYETLGGDVIIKPIFGGEGRGITRATDAAMAWRICATLVQLRAIVYMQEFISHAGFDTRALLIGDEMFGMRRENATDYRTNISLGAVGKSHTLDDEEISLARRAADVIGAPLAGVDLLRDREGQLFVIEVNAVPGWKATSVTLDIDIADRVLRYVAREVPLHHAKFNAGGSR